MDKRYLHKDERGSVIAVTDMSGAVLSINRYDDFGIPGAGNLGRFQYTGQQWLPEVGLYHYKARAYSPTLGRFMQGDPIGYGDGMNVYAYVGSDPVNFRDPTGLCGSEVVTEILDGTPTMVIKVTACGGSGGGWSWGWGRRGSGGPFRSRFASRDSGGGDTGAGREAPKAACRIATLAEDVGMFPVSAYGTDLRL